MRITAVVQGQSCSVGSRLLMSMMRELGHQNDRFKARSLMKEAGLESKQTGSHACKPRSLSGWTSRNYWLVILMCNNRIGCGAVISPTSGLVVAGITWPWCSIFIDVGSSVGPCQINLMPTWLLRPWTWHINNEAVPAMSCFIVTKVASTPVVNSDNGYGATGSPRA